MVVLGDASLAGAVMSDCIVVLGILSSGTREWVLLGHGFGKVGVRGPALRVQHLTGERRVRDGRVQAC